MRGVGHNRDKPRFTLPLLPAVCLGLGASPYPFVFVVCLNLKGVLCQREQGSVHQPALLRGVVSSLQDKRYNTVLPPEAIADSSSPDVKSELLMARGFCEFCCGSL